MALMRTLLVLLALGLLPTAARADDAKLYDLDACATAIAAAFQPLLAQPHVARTEPPAAALTLLADARPCPIGDAVRLRARDVLRDLDGALVGARREPEQEWLRGLSFGWGMPRTTGTASAILVNALDTLTAYSGKATPLAQALYVMANFEYRGPETMDGVPIVGDVLLGELRPGCGYGDWFRCPDGHMRWTPQGAARVRRWYRGHSPR